MNPYRVCILIVGFGVATCMVNVSSAHMIFKKTMEKKLTNLKVNCLACHVKGKPKTERNELGELFHKEFAEKNFSQRHKDIEDRDERKKFEKEEMAPAFLEALERVKKLETDDGQKYGELIEDAKLDGLKVKSSG